MSAPDLSKLRIDRDQPPPGLTRAVKRTMWLAGSAVLIMMYAAIAARSAEIAVLLTIGFKPFSILTSFLVESAIIAAVGGVVGCLFALPINGIVTSTTNWASFSEIAFSFRVTPTLLASGVIFAVVMGIVGGFLPAVRAARLNIVNALRGA